jgi:hypothetical protein
MMKLRVTFHNFENAPKNTKPCVLVFTGIKLVFLAASCQGDEMAEGDTEDLVWTEETFDCFVFFSISLYTLLHSKMVFGLKE